MKRLRNKKRIALLAYQWCCDTFGSPLKSGELPQIELVSNRHSNDLGLYWERIITINTVYHKSVSGIIRTVIHEYTHFLQMPKLYDMGKYHKLYKKYGYEQHPMEIDAVNSEKKHYRNCLRYLQRRKLI
jgi:hypothetical protein